jgi:hypothetical protein
MDSTDLSQVVDGAGPITGLFVLLLGLAIFIIWRSMNRQIKKIDVDLPDGPQDRRIEEDREFTEEAVERGEDEQRT